MDHIDIAKQIRAVSLNLAKAPKAISEHAKQFAEAEREYRMELGTQIMLLKAEGLQATLIPDVARSRTSDLKYKRDLAEGLYKSSIESSKALQASLSALQSLYRRQDEM